MGRKQTLELAQDAGIDRLVVSAVSKVGVLVPPWVVGGLVFVMAAVSHAKWGQPPAVTWATMAGTLVTVGSGALTWAVSHQRNLLGRAHATGTAVAGGMWFTIATITGVTADVTFGMFFFGGGALAVWWNIRVVIRQNNGESGHVDPLANLFDQAKEKFGLGGARVRTREVTDHKVKGKMALPPGERTQSDVVKSTDRIESGMRLPPGAVLISGDRDDASQVHFTVTDPRVMDKPIPWPGPSRPGGSMAEPVRIGLFQDSEYVEPVLPGNHLQIMGASGSGKSLGGTWNFGAEVITRRDVAFFGVDLAKDAQTFAPLRPGMHGMFITKERVVAFIRALKDEIPKRTKWLSDHGYTEWEPGCGLLFWVVAFEEVAKVFAEIGTKDEENVEQIAKEIRSAGGHIIMSLQKSIYSEMSTVVRSQLGMMCFGLNDSEDNPYGLTTAQKKAGADPSQWGAGKPEHVGKAYVDCRGIPETHVAMPLRTYAFGATPRAAAAALTAHATQWPAAARTMDEFTARLAALDPEGPRPGQAIPLPAGPPAHPAPPAASADDGEPEQDDAALELLATAAELVIAAQFVSSEMLQRKLRLSHEDCLRLLEALERRGIIGPDPGDPQVKREVRVSTEDIANGSTAVDDLRQDGDPVGEYLRTPDPSPEITAGPDDEIREPTLREDSHHVRDEGKKLLPAESRALLYRWIRDRHASSQGMFTAGDPGLLRVREETGNGRTWTYKALDELADRGVLEKTGKAYEIVSIEALDAVEHGVGASA